ncbi:S8 family peptidase [Algoriphagus yeomjeoni]|uniref:Subtilase family protein n=1 Tax=Algoriphagus yeomjeoni TaxID=291403 RepID=A0A327PAE5_9BACT|nr:S8 family peptidase [Algoriphagus yeomjeoni]RAI86806.1 subtilase family protein [Algoriphagus yeomjeoni]
MDGFFKHIFLDNKPTSSNFTPHGSGRFATNENINQAKHGGKLKTEFNEAFLDFWEGEPGNFVYVDIEAFSGFELDLTKFEGKYGDIRIANIKEGVNEDGVIKSKGSVFLSKKGINDFLRKIDDYSNLEKNTGKGNPKNASLLSNIESIKQATLESFWQEPERPFPHKDEEVWWEVWLDITVDSADTVKNAITTKLAEYGVQLATRHLLFPEHLVILIKGSPTRIMEPLLHSTYLDELRKPVELADTFTSMHIPEQKEWIGDLAKRLEINNECSISVCLLDSGINDAHPLLANLKSIIHSDTVEPSWNTDDSWPNSGHGNPMAGIIFFGDLTETFLNKDSVRIFHRLESIKILHHTHPTDPNFYGVITEEAIARAELINSISERVFCLAITADGVVHEGKPSSWSAAIDKSAFGEDEWKRLILISAGNIPNEHWPNYPTSNFEYSIHDPGQAFNALTIGAYTLKDRIDSTKYPGASLLAQRGQLSPSSSTSCSWDSDWPNKPEIVFEGGNCGMWNGGLCDPDTLLPLSISKGGLAKPPFCTFGDTSAATAFATKFAASILEIYPQLWQETIRALLVHSAQWTDQMLEGRRIEDLSKEEKIKLLTSVGYGVPFLPSAIYTLQNSVSLVIQETITPYKFEESRVKANECHIFTLPWPQEQLLELGEVQIKLNITLSYFVEPNPGNKRYANANNYASHGLRFKLKDRNESSSAFMARINKEARKALEGDYEKEGQENWVIGQQIRDKGSIHRDFWIGNAADLATKNELAVIPTGGWWKTRPIHKRYEQSSRYSLIVSIETESEDILTPILNELKLDVDSIVL